MTFARRIVGRCTLALMFVLGVAEAQAQQGWGPEPYTLAAPVSSSGAIYASKVAVDAAGNAVAAWTQSGPTSRGTPGPTVMGARYTTASGQWSPPVLLSGLAPSTLIDVAVDAAGNALAIWNAAASTHTYELRGARYDVATAVWSSADVTTGGLATGGALAMNAHGDAVVCAVEAATSLGCRRSAAGSTSWTPRQLLSSAASGVDLAIDGDGNTVAVWSVGTTAVQTSRLDALSGTWSPAADLATGLTGPGIPGVRVAMNAAGDTVATWNQAAVLNAARHPAGGAWSAPVVLASDGLSNEAAGPAVAPDGAVTVAWSHTGGNTRRIRVARAEPGGAWSAPLDLPGQGTSAYIPPSIATDGAGNVHVVWSQSLVSPLIRLLASRYAVSTGQWTTAANLSALNQSALNSDVAVDAAGNAIAVWFQTVQGYSAPQALRWTATPAAPVLEDVVPSTGAITVGVALPPTTDPALVPTTLEYSLDDGQTWLPRAPAGTARLVQIDGLVDGQRYALRVRAVNAAGPGAPSAAIGVRPGVLGAPQYVRVSARAGETVTFAWVPPPAGLEPTHYLLRATRGGDVVPIAQVSTGGPVTQFTLTVPPGPWVVSVVPVAGSAYGPAGGPVSLFDGAATPPQHVLTSVSGSTVAFSWTLAYNAAPPSALAAEVTAPQALAIPLPVGESAVVGGVPAGTYALRIRATSALGPSASDPVTVQAPGTCTGTPEPPLGFAVSTLGGRVFLDWLPPATGGAVSSYVVHVGGAVTATLPTTARSLALPAPSGSYTVRVSSQGLCGASAPTAAQSVVVP